MRTSERGIGWVALVWLLAAGACNSGSSPTIPTPAVPTLVQGPAALTQLTGQTFDTAFQELRDVDVEVTDEGVSARTLSGSEGVFSLSVPVGRNVTLRATKDGFRAVTLTTAGPLAIFLPPNDPPAPIEPGSYWLTFDSQCPAIPAELRRQRFSASIRTDPDPTHPNRFIVEPSGPFMPRPAGNLPAAGFWLGVAGRAAGTSEYDYLAWQLPGFRYFFFNFGGSGHNVTVGSSGELTFPFAGGQYCELTSALTYGNICMTAPASQVVAYSVCHPPITQTPLITLVRQ